MAKADQRRSRALAALAESGRSLSTAVVLYHAALSRQAGLTATEEKALELIARYERPSVKELAEHSGLAKNTVSEVVDRLVAKGFATRERDDRDRRRVAIVATEEGAARIGRLFEDLMQRLDALNADYTTEQLALVAEYQHRAAEIQAAAAAELTAPEA